MPRSIVVIVVATAILAACTDPAPAPAPAASASASAARAPAPQPRTPIDGHAFPDGVLALTWDDGPDARTVELATFLAHQHVSATFFVVGEWTAGVSDEPGAGRGVYESGYLHLPFLADLVARGHRLGNHTLHHVLLGSAAPHVVVEELGRNQRAIEPFLGNELVMFRAPGGSWSASASAAVDGDPQLARAIGPIGWDIDRKDWEGSLYCRSTRAAEECEPAAPDAQPRVRAAVTAQRYLATIETVRHGIVLFHDRVGHVGSSYALDVAKIVVPELVSRGYVLVAPVLHFSPLTTRWSGAEAEPARLALADVDGDGKADACLLGPAGASCGLAASAQASAGDAVPRVTFRAAWRSRTRGGAVFLADVDGDGRADTCTRSEHGVVCDAGASPGPFGGEGEMPTLRFADVDGDGKADVCGRVADGIACARSAGGRFDPVRRWLADAGNSGFELGDIDGDGKADVCMQSERGVACALSTGHAFGKLETWSAELHGADPSSMRLGDVNGDGRADVCALTASSEGGKGSSLACALATRHGFTRATAWLGELEDVAVPSLALGDVNGDRRADVCLRRSASPARVVCALAP